MPTDNNVTTATKTTGARWRWRWTYCWIERHIHTAPDDRKTYTQRCGGSMSVRVCHWMKCCIAVRNSSTNKKQPTNQNTCRFLRVPKCQTQHFSTFRNSSPPKACALAHSHTQQYNIKHICENAIVRDGERERASVYVCVIIVGFSREIELNAF